MVEDTMPPTIGAAIRRIISEPEPVLQRIGTSPAMMATNCHHLRPNALDSALHDRGAKVGTRQHAAFLRPPYARPRGRGRSA